MDAPQPPQQPPQQPPGGPWGDPGQWSAPQPAPGSVEKPQSIVTAVRLMQVGAAMSGLGIIFTFLQRDTIRDQLAEDDPSLSSSDLDAAVSVGIGFSVVIGLIAVGLWLWMAAANGQGKTWARTTATVLGGLNVLFTLIGLGMGQATGISIVVSIVGLVLAVAILVLIYRPDANRYYDVMSGRSGY